MNKLSIIIVNYNVRYFLEQCLRSVFQSDVNFNFDVWIVDNNSKDDSLLMLEQQFPQVKLIANKQNVGFAKANNQAIKQCNSEYVLLLNPDTIIQENTLQIVVDFMDKQEDAGAVGVKMLDGNGNFLPESKRGFPTPIAAISRMSGLDKLFSNSIIFGQYHLTYLSKDKTHEVDVLSGAFMLIKKICLNKIGLLDEAFFMYGEDIDLSYRLKQANFNNYYVADTSIIHFKGESTKKSTFNYVKTFYNAMLIFTKKHFGKTVNGKVLIFLLSVAIYLKASLVLIQNTIKKVFPVIKDALVIVGILFLMQSFWENFVLVKAHIRFPTSFQFFNIPLYTIIWLFTFWLFGRYDVNAKFKNLVVGLIIGFIVISLVYAFLPLSFRTSRGVIIVSTILLFAVFILLDYSMQLLFHRKKNYFSNNIKFATVANNIEAENILNFIHKDKKQYIGNIFHSDTKTHYLGKTIDVNEIVNAYHIDEIILSAKSLTSQEIIQTMQLCSNNVHFKIAMEHAIIGSDDKNKSGDIYTIDISYNLNKPIYKRLKRLLDILMCFVVIILFPLFLISKNSANWFKGIYLVLFKHYTWIGFDNINNNTINKNIFSISSFDYNEYIKNYTPFLDIQLLMKKF
ncbi:MAG: glycosyltransferase [Chitinophagales bacterium]|nr:glycosyltransferase [Chitinophagales bacterium]